MIDGAGYVTDGVHVLVLIVMLAARSQKDTGELTGLIKINRTHIL